MKTKGFSYDFENDLMFLKCLGCYRVWVFTAGWDLGRQTAGLFLMWPGLRSKRP